MNVNKLILSAVVVALSCSENKSVQNMTDKSKDGPEPVSYQSFEKEAQLYGEYYFSAKDISLELMKPDKFELAQNEIGGDVVIRELIAFGQFRVADDTVVLTDSLTQKRFYLLRRSEEILISLLCDPIPSGRKLLCWTKFFPNGQMKFTVKIRPTVACAPANAQRSDESISDGVSMPTFPGGIDALMKYLKANYKWRQGQDDVEGVVYVGFTISETGSVANPYIIRGLCETCDNEALRLIKEMPRWNAATVNGISKAERMVLPVRFGFSSPYK